VLLLAGCTTASKSERGAGGGASGMGGGGGGWRALTMQLVMPGAGGASLGKSSDQERKAAQVGRERGARCPLPA
jgi:hypothetical protein